LDGTAIGDGSSLVLLNSARVSTKVLVGFKNRYVGGKDSPKRMTCMHFWFLFTKPHPSYSMASLTSRLAGFDHLL